MARCAIALGSNLGDSWQILQAALATLHQPPQLTLLASSAVYLTAPVGPPQPDYLNSCALVETSLSPPDLLAQLLAIEANFGRVRRERWGPRHLDLDLLLYDQLVLSTPTLTLPHPRLRERAFVLAPLATIAPTWVEPVSGQTIQALWQSLDNQETDPQRVRPLPLQETKGR